MFQSLAKWTGFAAQSANPSEPPKPEDHLVLLVENLQTITLSCHYALQNLVHPWNKIIIAGVDPNKVPEKIPEKSSESTPEISTETPNAVNLPTTILNPTPSTTPTPIKVYLDEWANYLSSWVGSDPRFPDLTGLTPINVQKPTIEFLTARNMEELFRLPQMTRPEVTYLVWSSRVVYSSKRTGLVEYLKGLVDATPGKLISVQQLNSGLGDRLLLDKVYDKETFEEIKRNSEITTDLALKVHREFFTMHLGNHLESLISSMINDNMSSRHLLHPGLLIFRGGAFKIPEGMRYQKASNNNNLRVANCLLLTNYSSFDQSFQQEETLLDGYRNLAGFKTVNFDHSLLCQLKFFRYLDDIVKKIQSETPATHTITSTPTATDEKNEEKKEDLSASVISSNKVVPKGQPGFLLQLGTPQLPHLTYQQIIRFIVFLESMYNRYDLVGITEMLPILWLDLDDLRHKFIGHQKLHPRLRIPTGSDLSSILSVLRSIYTGVPIRTLLLTNPNLNQMTIFFKLMKDLLISQSQIVVKETNDAFSDKKIHRFDRLEFHQLYQYILTAPFGFRITSANEHEIVFELDKDLPVYRNN